MQLPGVLGLVERRALLDVLALSGDATLPEPLRAFAAAALTEALRSSRDTYLSAPTRWAAYLHVGA